MRAEGHIPGLAIALLTALTTATQAVVADPAPAWNGPRIEATATRWTWPSRLAFVNDAMRCTFAGTNENTQLQSIDLRTSESGWIPLTGRAGPRLERHKAAFESFKRLSDGFLMEWTLPATALEAVKGAAIRTGARLRLSGNTSRLVMEADILFRKTRKTSVECFSVDLSPALPHTLIWRHGKSNFTTNLTANSLFRLPAEAFAIAGSNGVAILRLSPKDADTTRLQSEILVKQNTRGTPCAFYILQEKPHIDQTLYLQLDLHLLPSNTSRGDILKHLSANRP